MTFGHKTRAFIEDGPVEQVEKMISLRSTARTWHALDAEKRLALIENALAVPANDIFDKFPLAL